MLFSSITFLCVFLPLVCLGYAALREELRNYWLILASLLFYAWGEPRYLSVMLFVIIVNYWIAKLFDNCPKCKKLVLSVSILINLGILIFFKYTNFIIENINLILDKPVTALQIVMPIGISFFIFQAMSYTIDVYRGDVRCQHDIKKLALYIALFPQLIAGPIVKYHDIEASIDKRSVNIDDIVYGVKRFILGLSKKVLIANNMGIVADKIYQAGPDGITTGIAWIGAISYSLQIFYDFSGYSDMAIGMGRIFGFHFLENFNYPYIASSMTDFWRRWHISLSTWFKEYLYIPLGGNRSSKIQTLRNLFLVFLATGIWHGASWNFVVWGLWHGFFIIVEKYFNKFRLSRPFSHIYVILVFVIGWVFFRADTLTLACNYIKVMCGLRQASPLYGLGYYITSKHVLVGFLAILFCKPWNMQVWRNNYIKECSYSCVLIVLLVLSMASIGASTYNPFIYFRF